MELEEALKVIGEALEMDETELRDRHNLRQLELTVSEFCDPCITASDCRELSTAFGVVADELEKEA